MKRGRELGSAGGDSGDMVDTNGFFPSPDRTGCGDSAQVVTEIRRSRDTRLCLREASAANVEGREIAPRMLRAPSLMLIVNPHQATGEFHVMPSRGKRFADFEPAAIVALAVIGAHAGALALVPLRIHAGR